jgi:hypothetical protein
VKIVNRRKGTMSTTPTTVTPAPTGVGVEVKAFFSKMGMDIKDIGTDIQKVITAAGKEAPVIEPVLNATLQQIFPTALIPVQVIEKVIGVALNAASQVATALIGEGLSPTADQVAAVAVAGLVHSLRIPAAASTAGSAPAAPASK